MHNATFEEQARQRTLDFFHTYCVENDMEKTLSLFSRHSSFIGWDTNETYLDYDATIFLSGTALNFVDHRMKNVIDRLLPLVTMYIHIVDGQCRHVPRYEKKLRFCLLYAGSADKAYLNHWMERVMLNFGGESLGVSPISDAKEVLSCIS